MMSIKDLYLACGNMHSEMLLRVRRKSGFQYDVVYNGKFSKMPDEVRNQIVVVFEIDSDLEGALFIIPA